MYIYICIYVLHIYIATAPGPDSCLYANDIYCDEPGHANYDNASDTCAAGTDTTDCSGSDMFWHPYAQKSLTNIPAHTYAHTQIRAEKTLSIV